MKKHLFFIKNKELKENIAKITINIKIIFSDLEGFIFSITK